HGHCDRHIPDPRTYQRQDIPPARPLRGHMAAQEQAMARDSQLVNTDWMMQAYAMKAALMITLLCSAAASIYAQEGSNAGTAAAIRSLEQQWTIGQSRNDNAALNLIFDNALIYVEYGKLVSKGDYLARIKHEEPESAEIEMEPVSVRIFGHTA